MKKAKHQICLCGVLLAFFSVIETAKAETLYDQQTREREEYYRQQDRQREQNRLRDQ